MKCIKCSEDIKVGDVCYKIMTGQIKEDEGIIYWNKAESASLYGYCHINCLGDKDETKEM